MLHVFLRLLRPKHPSSCRKPCEESEDTYSPPATFFETCDPRSIPFVSHAPYSLISLIFSNVHLPPLSCSFCLQSSRSSATPRASSSSSACPSTSTRLLSTMLPRPTPSPRPSSLVRLHSPCLYLFFASMAFRLVACTLVSVPELVLLV